MLVHITLQVTPPPHLVKSGATTERFAKIVAFTDAVTTVETALRQMSTTPHTEDILNAGGAVVILIQRQNPRPSGT